MKQDVVDFIAKCLTCQKVKAEHRVPIGALQPLEIPEWKWDSITMDFVTGLPKTRASHNAIWVIVDRLTKSAVFIPVLETWKVRQYARVYLKNVVTRFGVPKDIVSDRGSMFTSQFWDKLQEQLGTQIKLSTAFHPATDGQSERTIQILEDLLRASAMDFSDSWDEHLPLAEFAYNNSYQASLGMAPYEALYGRKCRSPLHWDEIGEKTLVGSDLVQQAVEKVLVIYQRMRVA